MIARLRNNFVTGLLVVLPAILTIVVFKFLIEKINNVMLAPMVKAFAPYLREPLMVYLAKGAAFVVIIIVVSLIGLATRNIITKKVISLGEKIFLKVPMINRVYGGIKEISHAFLGQSVKFFKRVVILEYPRKGVYSIGFVTSDTSGEAQSKIREDMVNVYVPTTPNPTSGILLLVPKDQTIPLEMSVEQGLKLVISGGAVVPGYEEKK